MASYFKGEFRFINYSKNSAIVKESACKTNAYSLAASTATQGTSIAAGFQSLVSGITAIAGSSASYIPAGTYKLNVKVDTGAIIEYSVVISSGSTWTQVAALFDTALTAVADVSISGVRLLFVSKTVGVTSAISITDGSTNGFIAAVNNIAISGTNRLVYVKGAFTAKEKGDFIKYTYGSNADGANNITIV